MPQPLAALPPDLPLLDPTLDVVFKRLFSDARNEDLLRNVLEATLSPPAPIAILEVLNRELPVHLVTDKVVSVDVRVRLANGEQIIVEMQAYWDSDLGDRFLVYITRTFAHELEPGDTHAEVVPVRLVAFLKHVRFPGRGLRTSFRMRDASGEVQLSEKLEVVAIQMPLFRALDSPADERHTDLALWVRFFQAKTKTDFVDLAEESPTMHRAVEALADLSRDRDMQRLADEYAVKAAATEWSIRKAMREERAAGMEAGRVTQAQMVLRLLQKRFGSLPGDTEARILEAAPADLERWCDRVIDAPSLDDVFASE